MDSASFFKNANFRLYSLATSEAFLQALNDWETSSTLHFEIREIFLFFASLNIWRMTSNQSSTSCFKSRHSWRPSPFESESTSKLRARSTNAAFLSSSDLISFRIVSSFPSFSMTSSHLLLSNSENSKNSDLILSPSINEASSPWSFKSNPWRCFASLWYFSVISSKCSLFLLILSANVSICSSRFCTRFWEALSESSSDMTSQWWRFSLGWRERITQAY